jgi:hypothetical protein
MARTLKCDAVRSGRKAWLIGLALAAQTGCQPATPKAATAAPAKGSSTSGPSKVMGAVKEAELTRVELTPQAEQRLGLTLFDVESAS